VRDVPRLVVTNVILGRNKPEKRKAHISKREMWAFVGEPFLEEMKN